MKPIGCKYMRNCLVSQIFFPLFSGLAVGRGLLCYCPFRKVSANAFGSGLFSTALAAFSIS